jgi:uncharacterized membrane protein YqjE
MQADEKGREAGLIGSLKALLATLVAIAHTRLELLGAELQEERARLAWLLVWGYVALFFAGLAVWFLCLTILIAFWDTPYRLLVAGGLALLFFVLAAVAVGSVVRLMHSERRLFDASLTELERDREDLGSRR